MPDCITPTESSQISSETSWVGSPTLLIPALLTSTSTYPRSRTAAWTAASTSAARGTLAREYRDPPRKFRGRARPRLRIGLHDGDRRALAGQLLSDRLADALAGPGDHRHPS